MYIFSSKLAFVLIQFGAKDIHFLRDKLSEVGVEPDKSKVQAILKMPRPTDRKAVLRVMGMINFFGKFIPNLSSKTVCLRELLRDKGEFKWTADHEQEWGRLKTLLTSEPVLTFFDPSKIEQRYRQMHPKMDWVQVYCRRRGTVGGQLHMPQER